MEELPKRKSTRFSEYDYNDPGAYFITICTKNRKKILSSVGDGVLDVPNDGVLDVPNGGVLDVPKVELLRCGFIADKYINQLNAFYENISVDNYVIMPNHIHIILLVSEDGQSGTPVPTRQNAVVSQFVSTLKRFINREVDDNIFQRSYYDHIIRDKDDYQEHVRYIHENPVRWRFDELYIKDSLT